MCAFWLLRLVRMAFVNGVMGFVSPEETESLGGEVMSTDSLLTSMDLFHVPEPHRTRLPSAFEGDRSGLPGGIRDRSRLGIPPRG